MDVREFDQNFNKIFIPVSHNPLHQSHTQIHQYGARSIVIQGSHTFDKSQSILSLPATLDNIASSSLLINDVSHTQVAPPKHIMTDTPQQFSSSPRIVAPVGKSNLKTATATGGVHYCCPDQSPSKWIGVGNNTSQSTSAMPGVKHVTWKTPEVDSVSIIPPRPRPQESSLSQQYPFKPTDSSTDLDHCGNIHVKQTGTQCMAFLPAVHNSRQTTIVAFTPRQCVPTRSTYITRVNLLRLLKKSTAQASMQGETISLPTRSTETPPIKEEAIMPPRIGRKLGLSISRIPCQTSSPTAQHHDFSMHRISHPPIIYPLSTSLDARLTPTEKLPIPGHSNHCDSDPSPSPIASSSTTFSTLPLVSTIGFGCIDKVPLAAKPPANTHFNQEEEPNRTLVAQNINVPRDAVTDFNNPIVDTSFVGVPTSFFKNRTTSPQPNEIPSLSSLSLVDPIPTQSLEVRVSQVTSAPSKPEARGYKKADGKSKGISSVGRQPDKNPLSAPVPSPGSTIAKAKIFAERSESQPQGKKVFVGKRKRYSEATVAIQPPLKARRTETLDDLVLLKMLMGSNYSDSLGAGYPDEYAQPWAPGAFAPRNRRLSLDSSNTEPPRDSRRIKFLTLPTVIEWKTRLDRIYYLYTQGKISKADTDELEDILLVVKANMDHPFLTAEWVKRSKMVMGVKVFRHKCPGVFTVASKRAAREIFDFWKASPRFGMACM